MGRWEMRTLTILPMPVAFAMMSTLAPHIRRPGGAAMMRDT